MTDFTSDTPRSCVACDNLATHISAEGDALCEEHRHAPEDFALLAERRKKAFDAAMLLLDAPERLVPGKWYPNADRFGEENTLYPDSVMCVVRTCAASFQYTPRGVFLTVGFKLVRVTSVGPRGLR